MTTCLVRNKKTRSTISLTKSTVIPNYLYLLTNPLHINDKIKDLHKLIQNHNIDQYPLYKYYKLNNNKNIIIYQYIDNELYILTLVIKNFFDVSEKELLFNNITKNLNIISNDFKNELKEIYNKKKNIRNTYTINGRFWTMQGHNAYTIPTLDEKYCFVAEFIQNNFRDQFDSFKILKKNRNNIYKNLFPLIIKLEHLIANLVKYRFSELYETFNISIPNIKTDLSFFKTFSINFSLQEKDQNIR